MGYQKLMKMVASTCVRSLSPSSRPPPRFIFVFFPSELLGQAPTLYVMPYSYVNNVIYIHAGLDFSGLRHQISQYAQQQQSLLQFHAVPSGPFGPLNCLQLATKLRPCRMSFLVR